MKRRPAVKKKPVMKKPTVKRKPTEHSDVNHLEWLLEFLRLDFAAIKPGHLLDVRNELFTHLHEDTLATITIHDDPDLRAFKPARAEESDPTVGLAREVLARVQRDLKAAADAWLDGGNWQPFGLIPDPDRPAPLFSYERLADGTIGHAYLGAWNTITLASGWDLLARWLPQLRRCAYAPCGVIFLPDERGARQKYHTTKCSAAQRWVRYAPKRDPQSEKERRALGTGPGRGKRGK